MVRFIKNKKFILALMFLVLLIFPTFVLGFTEKQELIVKYKSEKNLEMLQKKYHFDFDQINEIKNIGVYKIKDADFWQKARLYIDKYIARDVLYLEPDVKYESFLIPNDTSYPSQWALPKISAPTGWDMTTGSPAIRVAVVDTGVNGTHEDLAGKTLEGYNVLTSQTILANSNSDDHGHGTAIASVVAAVTNNSKGIAGMDWNAKIIPVKVMDQNGYGYSFDVAVGIVYAADHGAKIINLSLGGTTMSSAMKDAIDYAVDQKGVLVVAASGNSNTSVSYPAKYEKVVAVGATNQSDSRWYKSNYGPELDVVAPGEGILSANKNGYYWNLTGTSLATPHVSGLAALVLAKNPTYTNKQVELAIKNNTDKISIMEGNDFNNCCGYGRLNVFKALNSGGNYRAEYISQNSGPSLMQGEGYSFYIKLKNTGSATWKKNTVFLATDKPLYHTPPFTEAEGWVTGNKVEMQEDTVSTGGVATFIFRLNSQLNTNPGIYREYFRLISENGLLTDDLGIYWDIKVYSLAEAYRSCEWISQNADPNLLPGQSYNFYAKVKNTGLATWNKNNVFLATDKPENRIPVFERINSQNPTETSHWVSPNRIEMLEDSIAPGETATFSFWMSAPKNLGSGTYQEYFRLIAEGITWMDDISLHWDVLVSKPNYSASHVSQSTSPLYFTPGSTANLEVKFKNIGNITWYKNGDFPLRLSTDRLENEEFLKNFNNNWISTYRITGMDKDSVAPGETATFTFSIKIPGDIGAGKYRFNVRLLAENLTWFEPDVNGGAWWEIDIQKPVAKWVGQSESPISASKGQTINMWVKFKNTGSVDWLNNGPTPLILATDKYQNESFLNKFKNGSWVRDFRIVTLPVPSLGTNNDASFSFTITVPENLPSGKYRFFVRLVQENFSWFEPDVNGGAWWEINVK